MSETDKELLELAAKAAGIEVTAVVVDGIPHRFGSGYWNPLVDDGDALRLAVKLSLTVYHWTDEICVCNEKGTVNEDVARIGDIYAATRQCIVKAAAEIGRNMK